MFEHLDDPVPRLPDKAAVVARGRRLRRRRRAALGAAAALVPVIAAYAFVDRRDAAIERVEIATPVPSADGATNVLVVGTDATHGFGSRTDTIVVVRIEAGQPVRALFVPRDLWDAQEQRRINGARLEGRQALVDSITRLLGLPVDHYVELDFDGFASLVDAVGGLPVAVDLPIRDRSSGLDLAPAPCAELDGQAALALVRSRHLEVTLDEMTWTTDPHGDLGRLARGGVVLQIAMAELAAVDDPLELDRLTRLLADHAVLDDGLSLVRLAELGRLVAAAPSVEHDVVPVLPARVGEAAVLELAADAGEVLARYGAADRPAVPGAPSTSVDVLPAIRPCS